MEMCVVNPSYRSIDWLSKVKEYGQNEIVIAVADLHSKILNAPPFGPIFFIVMQFSVKFGQNIGWHPPVWLGSPPRKILDPSLYCFFLAQMFDYYDGEKLPDVIPEVLVAQIWYGTDHPEKEHRPMRNITSFQLNGPRNIQ